MAEAQKKAIVRLFDAAPVSGYLPAAGFAAADLITVMDTNGRVNWLPINEIKLIAYVRDSQIGNALDPERMGRRSFPARPRSEGLWVRMTFRDGDTLEGLAAADLTFLDSAVVDRGITVTPPDARSNVQRVYVPRAALSNLELLGVITRRKPAKLQEPQPWLFGDS